MFCTVNRLNRPFKLKWNSFQVRYLEDLKDNSCLVKPLEPHLFANHISQKIAFTV